MYWEPSKSICFSTHSQVFYFLECEKAKISFRWYFDPLWSSIFSKISVYYDTKGSPYLYHMKAGIRNDLIIDRNSCPVAKTQKQKFLCVLTTVAKAAHLPVLWQYTEHKISVEEMSNVLHKKLFYYWPCTENYRFVY